MDSDVLAGEGIVLVVPVMLVTVGLGAAVAAGVRPLVVIPGGATMLGIGVAMYLVARRQAAAQAAATDPDAGSPGGAGEGTTPMPDGATTGGQSPTRRHAAGTDGDSDAGTPDTGAAPDADPPTVRRGDAVRYATVGGSDGVREGVLAEGETVGARRLVLGPEATQPVRASPAELVLHVVDGRPAVSLDDETVRMSPGDTVRVPADDTYGLSNPDPDPATVLVAIGHGA